MKCQYLLLLAAICSKKIGSLRIRERLLQHPFHHLAPWQGFGNLCFAEFVERISTADKNRGFRSSQKSEDLMQEPFSPAAGATAKLLARLYPSMLWVCLISSLQRIVLLPDQTSATLSVFQPQASCQ